jgi:hypothetical protein
MRSLRDCEQETDPFQAKYILAAGILLVSYGSASFFRFNGFHLSHFGKFQAGTPTSGMHGKAKLIFYTSAIWHNNSPISY